MTVKTFNASGITFRQKDDPSLLTARPTGVVDIRPELDNRYDPRALAIFWQGKHIGYVPADDTQKRKAVATGSEPFLIQSIIHDMLNSDGSVTAEIESYAYRNGDEFNDMHIGELGAITIAIEMPDGQKQDTSISMTDFARMTEKMESFNEPGVELDFDPAGHVYRHKGVAQTSVTQLVAKMYAPFDKQAVSARCAVAWGMTQAAILDMWDRNGACASGLGTAIHGAIENYERHGERALPKHPLLRDAVLSFPWGHTRGMKVHSEVLITCIGRRVCGMADRLVDNGGKLTVSDLKVNVEAEAEKAISKNLIFPDLPKNKISKAQCQMSIYAEMLEMSGLPVGDSVVAYYYTGEWAHYVLPRLRGVLEAVQNVSVQAAMGGER